MTYLNARSEISRWGWERQSRTMKARFLAGRGSVSGCARKQPAPPNRARQQAGLSCDPILETEYKPSRSHHPGAGARISSNPLILLEILPVAWPGLQRG